MPRVVPTEVRDVIVAIQSLQFLRSKAPEHQIPRGHSAELAIVLALVDRISPELITLTGLDHTKYLMSVETIRHQLTWWQTNHDPDRLKPVQGENTLGVLYDALTMCPDEAPAPTTVELKFVTDPALRESIRLDISTANRNLIEREWKAAAIFAGAATEALLLWAIDEQDKKATGSIAQIVGAMKLPPNKPDKRLKWTLAEMIRVAEAAKLIENETVKQASLANDFRNLIHPGRVLRLDKKPDRARALGALAAAEAVARDLS